MQKCFQLEEADDFRARVSAIQAAPITSGRAPGFPIRLARLFHRTIGQAPQAHEFHDTAAQGPAQLEPGGGGHPRQWRRTVRTPVPKKSSHLVSRR
jgi:hypothetical protein